MIDILFLGLARSSLNIHCWPLNDNFLNEGGDGVNFGNEGLKSLNYTIYGHSLIFGVPKILKI